MHFYVQDKRTDEDERRQRRLGVSGGVGVGCLCDGDLVGIYIWAASMCCGGGGDGGGRVPAKCCRVVGNGHARGKFRSQHTQKMVVRFIVCVHMSTCQ